MGRHWSVLFGVCVVGLRGAGTVSHRAAHGCPCGWCCFVHPLILVSKGWLTLAFDSSPIKGEGDWWVWLVVSPTLWILP